MPLGLKSGIPFCFWHGTDGQKLLRGTDPVSYTHLDVYKRQQFDLDTDALPYGVAAYAAYAMKYLEENPQFSFQPFPGDIDEMMAYTDRPVPPRLDPEM